MTGDGTLSSIELQQKMDTALAAHQQHRRPSRAQIISNQLMEEVRPVRPLLRALAQQRGEALNALKRSIHVRHASTYQAQQHEEMQAVADALGLLANLAMACNTMKIQFQ